MVRNYSVVDFLYSIVNKIIGWEISKSLHLMHFTQYPKFLWN